MRPDQRFSRCDLETAGASSLNQKWTELNEKHSFIFCRIVKHKQNWRQLISSNLDRCFVSERWQFSLSFDFWFWSLSETTVERRNHTPDGPPGCQPGGFGVAQNHFSLGCFSKITTEKYVERLEMKLWKYDSFLTWQKWTLCEERIATRIITLIYVVNVFPFHLGECVWHKERTT